MIYLYILMIALVWISIIFCLLSVGIFIYFFIKFKKDVNLVTFNKRYLVVFIGCIGAFTLFSLLGGISIKLANNFAMDTGHIIMLIFGSLFFGVSIMSLFETFVIYYYKTNLDPKIRNLIRRIMFILIPLTIIFLLISIESYAPYVSYPLISGMQFSQEGIVWLVGNQGASGFAIKWYGVIILLGAVVAYFVCDHHFYLEYKRHGIIDSLFILVFIFGILGARLWAVYILPTEMGVPFWEFQRGGLGIMGGVFLGATVGILFVVFFRRYINLRHAMDLVLPCVLIAQVIGRWGNFFNQEVYGSIVSEESISWLPLFIRGNMYIDGAYRMPLFLIESVINLAGYFLIVYGVGKGLKKHLSLGDLFCLYMTWYGMVRIILEPLRFAQFENLESIITAWVMFGGGILGIIGLHFYDYFRWGKSTFKIKDDPRLHNPKNPYYQKVENNEVH